MAPPTQAVPYKAVQLFPTDPEWSFVWHHFYHQKPTKYSLGKVLIVHDRHQQQAFEQHLSTQEREAPKFPPNWNEEPRAAQRAHAIQRWKESVSPFSPFESMESDGRRHTWKATKVLPLFHGTKKEICHSICESGHTFFGKTSLSKAAGAPHSTDDGYFGSGIYFTNSARYAADIYAQGHLLMSWVSMREPFPFVGDPTQEDMRQLRGKGAYKHYNAHYVPVSPFDPTDPNCPEYHPTQEGQLPTYDEYVVFNPPQTLPRFWIHLIVDALFLKNISIQPQHVEDLIPHLMTLLQNPHVDADKRLRRHLNEKLEFLLKQTPDEYLDELELDTLFQDLQTLLDASGKVNRSAAKALMGTPASAMPAAAAAAVASPPLTKSPTKTASPSTPSIQPSSKPKPPAPVPLSLSGAAAQSSLPPTAFGALKWKQYFGEIGEEPPLPPGIQKTLQSPCSFWPGKTVQDTHMLVLIPKTVNGAALTLSRLQELVKHPKQGPATQYQYYWDEAQKALGDQPVSQSSWVLMTKDVIPESRFKNYGDQSKLVETWRQKTGIPYQIPGTLEAAVCILLEHVQSGTRLYSDSPSWTYTRCHEKGASCQMAVGGFGAAGLRVYGIVGDYGSLGVACLRKS